MALSFRNNQKPLAPIPDKDVLPAGTGVIEKPGLLQRVKDFIRGYFVPTTKGSKITFAKEKEEEEGIDIEKAMPTPTPTPEPVPTIKPTPTPIPKEDLEKRPYYNEIKSVFKHLDNEAHQVLKHFDPAIGENKGENQEYKATNIDVANNDGTVDRGLFRINSGTFTDFMNRSKELLNKNGIYSWEDMNDVNKNIRMAKIIYNEQGWGAWYAAPENLRNKPIETISFKGGNGSIFY